MYRNIIFFSLWLLPFNLSAQKVLWAAELLDFSTQYSDRQYAAEQVLGRPDVLPQFRASPCAWAPLKEESRMPQFVRVRFKEAIHVEQIAIAENLNPGAIHQIILYDEKGRHHIVYEHKEDFREFIGIGRMFHHMIERTPYRCNELKLVLNTRQAGGMNQIDAIALADHREPVLPEIRRVQYEEEIALENLGPMVNSAYDDMRPMITPDGQRLYFVRKRHPQNEGVEKRDDIWISERDAEGRWGPAYNAGYPLNNEHHNFVCAISPDGNKLLLSHDYLKLGIGFRLSQAFWRGDRWSFPRALDIDDLYSENEFADAHQNVHANVLLMAIEREDSYGDMDLYVSFHRGGNEWSAPINLGPDINTAAKEGSIFLAADNRTIYFASEGYSGYGGFDMYMSRRLDDSWQRWTEPLNLGPPINTERDEYYYSIPASGDYIYFSSSYSRFGGADLYRAPLPEVIRPFPVNMITATVFDALSNKPVEARISLRSPSIEPLKEQDLQTHMQFIIPVQDIFQLSIEAEGYFPQLRPLQIPVYDPQAFSDFDDTDLDAIAIRELRLGLWDSLYARVMGSDTMAYQETLPDTLVPGIFSAEERQQIEERKKQFYAEVKEEVLQELKERKNKLQTFQAFEEQIKLIPIKEGQVIRLNQILFTANKAFLRKESKEELDKVAGFLVSRPDLSVEIAGHTNGLPGPEFCQKLSTARAKRVMEYLIEEGVSKKQLSAVGYGKSQPVATNKTREGRQLNQRVELRILKVGQ